MNISLKKTKSEAVFTLDGELTIYTVAQAKRDLLDHCDDLPASVALDLHGVSEIDTAGIQLLLFTQHLIAKDKKILHIIKSNEHVDDVIENLSVASYFIMDT